MNKQKLTEISEKVCKKAIAKLHGKKASIPEVGFFWIDMTGLMYAESVPVNSVKDYGGFKGLDASHYDVWNKAVRTNPKWKGLEYEDVPRGRVIWQAGEGGKDNEFIVYVPKQLLKFKNKVISRFNLPSGNTRFDTSDEHYQIAAGFKGVGGLC